MANISHVVSHGTGAEDAARRTSELLKALAAEKPHLFKSVKWSPDGRHATMTGKGFEATFIVDEANVNVEIRLGLLARPFKGKVESSLRRRLEAEFG